VGLPNIPAVLYGDILFQQYPCPITQLPIRNPVRDPTCGQLFERRAIVAWLQQHPHSPLTRQPLTVAELVEAPEVELQIRNRLQQYQDGLLGFIRNHEAAPVEPAPAPAEHAAAPVAQVRH
jgi:hypothetical protein